MLYNTSALEATAIGIAETIECAVRFPIRLGDTRS